MNLPSNATLIDKNPVLNSEYLSIVLCRVEKGYANAIGEPDVEFVTWVYNHEFDGCVMGHYFNNLTEAVEDFKERF